MIKKYIVIIGCCFSLSAMEPGPAAPTIEPVFPGITKISDDLYVGKVNDDFYLAMERVNKDNVELWLEYVRKQYATHAPLKNNPYLPNTTGSSNFAGVLDDYKNGVIEPYHELWVAYASTAPITQHIKTADNPSIDMFVTVITTPEALVTSHMGISRSVQAAIEIPAGTRKKQPDQSIHLHSFAAKVMKWLHPEKVYMLNMPVPAMRDILVNKMPANSVFVGDNLYQEYLEAVRTGARKLVDEWDLKDYNETWWARRKRLKDIAAWRYKRFYEKKIAMLKTNPPRIIRVKDDKTGQFTILKPNKELLVTFDKTSSIYHWLFTFNYINTFGEPHVLTDLATLARTTNLDTAYTPAA